MRKRDRTEPAPPRVEADAQDDGWGPVLLVPVWIGLFLGAWAGIDRLLASAPRAVRDFTAMRRGAEALAGARDVVAPILGFLLGTYAIVLLGAARRRLRGEPSPCEEPDDAPGSQRSGVPRALREASAIAQVERELRRARRGERSGARRAALAVNDRLMLGALRRRGYNDDIGCGGIVLILLGATVALPFASEAVGRAVGFELATPLAVPLWFALVYGGFCARWLWKWSRSS